jgi:hypothetical protein
MCRSAWRCKRGAVEEVISFFPLAIGRAGVEVAAAELRRGDMQVVGGGGAQTLLTVCLVPHPDTGPRMYLAPSERKRANGDAERVVVLSDNRAIKTCFSRLFCGVATLVATAKRVLAEAGLLLRCRH